MPKGRGMQLEPFHLERYFARHEFSAPWLLSPSDCETFTLQELLALADDEGRALWEGLALGYTDSQGHPRLLEEIRGLYSEQVHALEVVPVEGILLAMMALLEPGDEVVATAPAYQALHEVARGRGCRVIPWRPGPGWVFDVEEGLALLTGRTRLLVVNFPHNPTGALPTRAEFARLLHGADRRGVRVFSDEMYRWSEYDPADRLPSACEVLPGALALGGLSKPFGLPGLRVGWLASQDPEVLGRLCRWKDYTTLCGSAPSEVLALMALRARDRLLARNRAILQGNLALLEDFVRSHPEWLSWTRPRAGSVAFPRLEARTTVEDLADDLVARHGVMMAPGSLFGYPGNHFRVGFGRRRFPLVLERFGEAMRELARDL